MYKINASVKNKIFSASSTGLCWLQSFVDTIQIDNAIMIVLIMPHIGYAYCITALFVFQGKSKYPLNSIQDVGIKAVIVSQLVCPVVRNGERVDTFRVIWRQKGEQADATWRSIVEIRERCDALVQRERHVQLYASNITGVYNKNTQQLCVVDRYVWPAISYWVVRCGRAVIDSPALWQRLGDAFPAAAVKPITVCSRRLADHSSDAHISGPLFVVLKDHNSSFVRRRIAQSLHHRGSRPTAHAPAKVVSVGPRYARHLAQSKLVFSRAGLFADIEIVGGGTDALNAEVRLSDGTEINLKPIIY